MHVLLQENIGIVLEQQGKLAEASKSTVRRFFLLDSIFDSKNAALFSISAASP